MSTVIAGGLTNTPTDPSLFGGATPEQVAAAVADYIAKNPVNAPSAEQIASAVEEYLKNNPISGGVDAEQLTQAVNAALQTAKESGEFDGPQGEPGKTPVKGEDYFTEADKAAIVDAAIADSRLNLPIYSMDSNSGLSHADIPAGSVELTINGLPYDNPNYNGGFSTTENARRSDYIAITNDMASIRAVCYMGTTGCLLSFYDADKVRIDELDILGKAEKFQTEVVDLTDEAYSKAKYFIVAYYDAGKIFERYECTITYKAQGSTTDRGLNILIFGDSITETASINLDGNDCTSAYAGRTASYVNAAGNTVVYNKWPVLIQRILKCEDVRNYAKSGASYKEEARESGQERRNLSYQVRVALNDLDNPNGVFPSTHYDPDIVIFSLGTNDGAPNDTPDSAMSKIVLASDGFSVDADATLVSLDKTKFCEAAMWAFLTIKKAFPMAMCFCALPIQRAQGEVNTGTLHEYLSQIAKRYGCIVIDGAYESGIVRDLEVRGGLGAMLHDGLHPNDKGQNLLARMILTAIRRYYLPFDGMN